MKRYKGEIDPIALIVIVIIIGFFGCMSIGLISEDSVKKAEIADRQTLIVKGEFTYLGEIYKITKMEKTE